VSAITQPIEGAVVIAAVRVDNSGPWVDLGSVSHTREGAEILVKTKNRDAAAWAARNPVVRYGTFRLEEVRP
jgi:hypothetical protein